MNVKAVNHYEEGQCCAGFIKGCEKQVGLNLYAYSKYSHVSFVCSIFKNHGGSQLGFMITKAACMGIVVSMNKKSGNGLLLSLVCIWIKKKEGNALLFL